MASPGDNKIELIYGDSISWAVVVSDAQRWQNKIAVAKGLLESDIISVSNPGKTLRNLTGSTQSNSLLWELVYNGIGNLDSPTYAFYEYSTRINEVFFRIGANDVIQGSSTWETDLETLFDIFSGYPRNKLNWINIGMVGSGWGVTAGQIEDYNGIAQSVCDNFDVKYLDLNSRQVAKGDYLPECTEDNLHPNITGHVYDAIEIVNLQQPPSIVYGFGGRRYNRN